MINYYEEDYRIEQSENRSDYNIGDFVICKIKDSLFVNQYDDFDEKAEFVIIGKMFQNSVWEYIIFIPYDILQRTKSSNIITVNQKISDLYDINKKFKNERCMKLNTIGIFKISKAANGMCCYKCSEFYHYAEPNQENGKMICWSCRQNPYR